MSIWSKLAAIQMALKVPKDQYNDHGKYNYRSGEDILEAVKPLAAAQGTLVLLTDALEQIGTRYYIRATVSLIDIETGEQVSVNAWAREQEERKGYDASQITGASSSYARKYALSALFAIGDSSNDPDATNTHGQAPNKPSVGRSRGQATNNQVAAKKSAEGLKSGSGTDAALKAAQQQAKAARQAYINATGADPAEVDAALKTVKGATWHTAEGCKIIIDTIAYWQANGK